MNLAELQQQDRRLIILKSLALEPDYALNEGILQAALQQLGHAASFDTVRADLSWLQEQCLVTIKQLASTQIATATQRGFDVGTGHAMVHGVKRPRPE